MAIQRKGFTLVELSIVLVIIGLLIGGVLKGQSMIENTKVKRLAADMDGLLAAAYGYQDKFGSFPGDDANAIARGAAANGNGDGLYTAAEIPGFYQNLAANGFIAGDTVGTPKKSPYGGSYNLVNNSNITTVMSGNQITTTAIPPDIAESLDIKYDDGVYNTGTFRANTAYTTTALKTIYWSKF